MPDAPTVGSLCTGCAGLDLGLENVGYRTIWQAENDDACSRVLKERFDVPNLGDLTTIRWEDVEVPDVVAAGFPCQPVSLAGRGLIEADPRWLWPEVARCLRVVRPRFVLLENVPGLFRRPPGGGPRPVVAVHDGLAALGYDTVWTGLRAADVGAPHGRDRWFCAGVSAAESELAGVDADRRVRGRGAGESGGSAQAAVSAGEEVARAEDALEDRPGASADAGGERRDGGGGGDARRSPARGRDGRAVATGSAEASADPDDSGRGELRRPEPAGTEHAATERGRETASDPGRDGFVREQAVDGADGGVGVESGDDADRRDLGDAGAGDGHARQVASDADGVSSWGSERGVEGDGRRGRASGDSEVAADADGAGPESGCGRRTTGGDPARAVAEVGERYGHDGSADQEGAGAAAADASCGDEQELAAGDGRERSVVGTVARAGGRDRGGDAAEGVPDVGGSAGVEWGAYEPAIRKWEGLLGRAAPRPTDDLGRLDPRFVSWMLGFPDGWVDVNGMARTAQLRMLGNAVQVQCAEVIGVWLAEIGGFA